MRKIIPGIFILFSPYFLKAQTTLYSQNFESGSTGWAFDAAAENHWLRNNVYIGSFFTNTPDQVSPITNFPNSYYMHIASYTGNALGDDQAVFATGTAATTYTTLTTDIVTSGYTGVSLSFYYLSFGFYNTLTPTFNSFGTAEYSINGGVSWNQLGTELHDIGSWTLFNVANAAMDNQATVRIRFKWVTGATGNDPAFSVDQIVVSGTLGAAVTITTSAIAPPLTFCAGASVNVPFTITGTFTAGNIFTAQLSNAAGSFAAPVSIGTLAGTTAGTIAATIPAGTAAGAGYRIRVVSSAPVATGTDNGANITINALPAITTPPSNQSACVGGNATFCVIASGTGLTYQWRKGGINIAGATLNCYNISSVSLSDAGNYDVVISGTCTPPVTSATVSLTVNTAPAITVQPSPQTFCVPGGTATFSVTATGSGLTYQWNKGGTNLVDGGNISGALTSTLTISPVSFADTAFNYYVKVSGTCIPAATSNNAALSIAPLSVSATASSSTICAGSSCTLTGNGATTYSWMPGSLTGTTVIVTPLVSTTYTVIGTSGSCSDTNTTLIMVQALPSVSLSTFNPDTVCNHSSPFALPAGTPAGGTYTGAGVSAGMFDPNMAGLGLHNIIYTITVSGCSNSDTSAVFVDICAGIPMNDYNSEIEIYPNPSTGTIYFRFENLPGEVNDFSIRNILGEKVFSGKTNSSGLISSIHLERGIFFMELKGVKSRAVKIIVY